MTVWTDHYVSENVKQFKMFPSNVRPILILVNVLIFWKIDFMASFLWRHQNYHYHYPWTIIIPFLRVHYFWSYSNRPWKNWVLVHLQGHRLLYNHLVNASDLYSPRILIRQRNWWKLRTRLPYGSSWKLNICWTEWRRHHFQNNHHRANSSMIATKMIWKHVLLLVFTV